MNGSGARGVLIVPKGQVLEHGLQSAFHASHKQAEYEIVIAGLKLVSHMGTNRVILCSDPQLVIN